MSKKAIRAAELAGARSLLRSLTSELGLIATLFVLSKVAIKQAQGKPFSTLGPPSDQRDKLSRRQLSSLVNLHTVLQRRIGQQKSFAIARKAALAGGIVFLDLMLPSPETALENLSTVIESFFNAEGTSRVHDGGVEFTVSRCRFVELLDQVGAPELKPIFCEVDSVYFANELVPITLRRESTLAKGDACCDFRFTRAGPT